MGEGERKEGSEREREGERGRYDVSERSEVTPLPGIRKRSIAPLSAIHCECAPSARGLHSFTSSA